MIKTTVAFLLLISSSVAWSQMPAKTKLPEFKQMLAAESDKILVVNFWATWCAPCIKELPYFEQLTAKNQPSVEVVLVSMDLDLDPDPEKVRKFVERRKIKSKVIMLDEVNPNAWINQIEERWSGALPATIIINQKTGQRKFVEGELHEGDLERMIQEIN